MELSAVALGVFEGDGHALLGRGQGVAFERGASEIHLLVVDGSPLSGLLVDDELPGIGGGQGVDGVGAGGNGEGADLEVGGGDEGGGGVGTGAPDLAVGHQAAHDLAAAHGGGAVFDGDGFAVEGDAGGGGRAGHLSQAGGGEEERTGEGCDGTSMHWSSLFRGCAVVHLMLDCGSCFVNLG